MRPIGRLAHPPFRIPAPEEVSIAATAARLLSAGSNGRGTGVVGSRRGAPDAGSPGRTLEAAVFAVLLDAPLVVATVEPFRDLVRVSAWSMNAPGRPPDGVLARHLGIAERATDGFRPLAASALDALLAGDGPAVAASLRARRRAAKADGPPRFKLLAARSAGLRPLVLYVDLLPALAAGGEKASAWLGTLERGHAEALLGISIALFI